MENFSVMTRQAMSNTAVSVMEVQGALDINTVEAFETALQRLFNQKQFKIILNFEKLTYVSSAGIGVMVGLIRDVRKNRGDIKITHTPPEIFKIFDLLELPGLLHFVKTEQEAAAQF